MEQPILNPSRFGLAEFERQDWVATAEMGIKPEDLLDPGYWAHVSARMKPFDRIEIRAEDGSWIAELLVLGCDRNWAKIHIMSAHNLTNTDVSQTQSASIQHKVEWKGPHKKFVVIRLADSNILKEGIADKAEAYLWMREHEKVTG